ncbi:hypothetical protein [Rhizobium lentis]|uniref:Uncharacterized protein n=1 Tax=Rhizobium lentis TaxID=1138194 RepID=A0A9Q3MET1_9HYPH|nr:hypothetical protein [Rhizobium lentis]MBX4956096.1 hypothetical protein [Rhizobium lentis]MBX4974250.1 hypothetical protein [Rhizobium lentis]MBX5012308.1 hypothetical protein [Rhizobium lentis]MBX5018482.1 hypothetical protein [Rhizobium lentis]MBX5024564.1 hypothetical protein [Rhizobium lentis]
MIPTVILPSKKLACPVLADILRETRARKNAFQFIRISKQQRNMISAALRHVCCTATFRLMSLSGSVL